MVNSYIQYRKISTWKLRLELVLSSSRTPGMFSQMYLGQKVIEGYSRLPLSLRVSYIQSDTCSRLPCPAGPGIQRSTAGCPVLQGLEYRGVQQAALSCRVWNTEYSRLPCPAGSGIQRSTAGCPCPSDYHISAVLVSLNMQSGKAGCPCPLKELSHQIINAWK
jgi:hypothetical protein